MTESEAVQPRINYVLVDHENVQPTDVKALDRADVRLWVFVGSKQTKLSAQVAMQMQDMGERARYVRVSAVGANALDFHIAYSIGRLAEKDPSGFFHVISKDKGYDPLLAHLKENGISGSRSETIAAMPLFKSMAAVKKSPAGTTLAKPKTAKQASKRVYFVVDPEQAPMGHGAAKTSPASLIPAPVLPLAESKGTAQRWMKLRASLKKMNRNLPSSLSALKKHVHAQFNGDKVGQDAVDAMVAGLVKFGLLAVAANGRLTWHTDKF